jgi:DNA-binding SARP family transcriptional activator/tetratricopeptide (TPR) repeat protein
MRLRLFGPCRVEGAAAADGSVRLTGRMALALARVALGGEGPLTRRALAAFLWPDTTDAQALRNLRQLLFRLRQRWPEVGDWLDLESSLVRVRRADAVEVDVHRFEALARSSAPADWEEALALARQPLLEGEEEGGDGEWLSWQRRRLEEVVVSLLDRLATHGESRRDYRRADRFLEAWMALDPYAEFLCARRMRDLALAGDPVKALEVYRRWVTALDQDLGVRPATALEELADRLGRTLPVALAEPPRPPLVGRGEEWLQLLQAWEAAGRGRAQVVWVEGEAGIGKTRLAQELAHAAERLGARVFRTACLSSGDSPYGPVRMALRQAVTPAQEGAEADGDRFEGWARRLAPREPVLWLLDDGHWAMGETVAFLRYYLTRYAGSPLLLVVTARNVSQAWEGWWESLNGSGRLRAVRLSPLTREEGSELFSLLRPGAGSHSFEEAWRESAGNAWRLVERAQVVGGGGEELARRVATLRPVHRRVVAALAVLSHPLSLAQLAALTGQATGTTLRAVDALQELGWVSVRQGVEVGLAHDLFTQEILRALPPPTVRATAALLARRLLQRGGPNAEAARLWLLAGNPQEARAALLQALEEARRTDAFGTVEWCLRQLLTLGGHTPEEEGTWLSLLGLALERLGRTAEAEAAWQDALDVTRRHDLPLPRAQALMMRAGKRSDHGEHATALADVEEAFALFSQAGDAAGMAESLAIRGKIYGMQGDELQAARDFGQGYRHARRAGYLSAASQCLLNLGVLHHQRGHFDHALRRFRQAMQLAREASALQGVLAALNNMGVAARAAGRYQQAVAFHLDQVRQAHRSDVRRAMGVGLYHLGRAYDAWGQAEDAERALHAALSTSLVVADHLTAARSACAADPPWRRERTAGGAGAHALGLGLLRSLGAWSHVCEELVALAWGYVEAGMYGSADAAAAEAYRLARDLQLGLIVHRARIVAGLVEAQTGRCDATEAWEEVWAATRSRADDVRREAWLALTYLPPPNPEAKERVAGYVRELVRDVPSVRHRTAYRRWFGHEYPVPAPLPSPDGPWLEEETKLPWEGLLAQLAELVAPPAKVT